MNPLTLARSIQQLVDGEISQTDRATLLEYAEQHHDIYRTIALSFVEREIWDHELQESVDANGLFVEADHEQDPVLDCQQEHSRSLYLSARENQETTHTSMAVNNFRHDRGAILSAGMNKAGRQHQTRSQRFRSSNDSRFHVTVAQLAISTVVAAVLIGFAGGGIGWWMALRESSDGSTKNRFSSMRDHSDSIRYRSDVKPDPARTRPLPSDSLNESFDTAVGNVRPVAFTLPSEVQMQLLRSGFVVEEQFNFVDVQLDSGQSVPVPVNELRVNYFGNRLYQ